MPDISRQRLHKVSIVPTLDTGAYVANDAMHTGAIVLSNIIRKMNHSCEVVSCVVNDLDAQNGAMSFHFFSQNPSTSTITANSALDIADSEMPNHLGSFAIAAGDYEAFADNSAATKVNIGLALKADSDVRDLYLVIKSKDTKTYTASGLKISFLIRQD